MNNLNSNMSLGRREQERKWRRQYILKVAERLFAQKGYHQTTMAEIAKASEFGMSTIYQFFESKEKIYLTLFNEKLDTLLELVKNAVKKASTATEKIKAILKVEFDFFQKNKDFFRLYAMEREAITVIVREELGKEVNKKHEEGLALLKQIIEEGIKNKEFYPFPPAEVAILFSGMTQAYIHDWIKSGKEINLDEKIKIITNFFLKGIHWREK